MPRSVFLGRIAVDGEPLWTQEDRDWAIALLSLEADTCSGCGQPRSETTDPDNEFGHFVAEPIRCYGCKAVARASEAFTVPGADARGLLIGVTRQDRR